MAENQLRTCASCFWRRGVPKHGCPAAVMHICYKTMSEIIGIDYCSPKLYRNRYTREPVKAPAKKEMEVYLL